MNSSVRPLSLLGSSLLVALMLSGCGPSKTELAKEIATLKEQLSQRQTEGKSLEQQVASIRSDLDTERKALNEARTAAENSARIVSELRAAQATRDSRIEELSRDRQQQETKVRELAKATQEHETRQAQLQRELDTATASARQAQVERDSAMTSERQAQAERDSAVTSARQAQAERDSATAAARQAQAELQQRLELSQTALRSATAERDSLAAALAAARERLAAIDRDLKQNTGNLEQEQKRASELTDRLSAALSEQSKLRQSTDAQRAEIASISAALADAQAKVALLTGARGIYTVQEGDSLSSIALYFYRNASRWPGVAQANRHLINHPDKIFPAMVLIIPK